MNLPEILRAAARDMENEVQLPGHNGKGEAQPFPCFHVAQIADGRWSGWERSEACHAFLRVFSEGKRPVILSGSFINELMTPDDNRDGVILALCFAAAVIEAGDAPWGELRPCMDQTCVAHRDMNGGCTLCDAPCF